MKLRGKDARGRGEDYFNGFLRQIKFFYNIKTQVLSYGGEGGGGGATYLPVLAILLISD